MARVTRLEISERLYLRPVAEGDAEAIYALVDADRERLAEWLPWAAGQTLAGTREFIAESRAQEARDDGFKAALVRDGEVAGMAIPERLGFAEEGVMREAELVGGRFLDAVVYSMLASEWPAAGSS
jgi:RimJ/RimL family protein N-acetyltransferase